ncbi:LamG domain-containing protein [Archangium sp.]|uniref:LamG domain-containing protein n=1 Tax=Archangium sp. TaxID=1872627 RepID=UPI0039C86C2F
MDGPNGSRVFTDVLGGTFTAYGQAQLSTTQSRFGGASAYFDGSGDYIQSEINPAFNFTDGHPFTLEAWVNGTGIIFSNDHWGIVLLIDSTNGLRLSIAGVLPWTGVMNLVGHVPAGWHHVALSYDSATYRIFVDGVLTFSAHGRMTNQTYHHLVIGSYSNGIQPFFKGFIDEFRLTRGVALYTNSFTIPASPFPNP